MKMYLFVAPILFCTFVINNSSLEKDTATLNVQINNCRSSKGKVLIAVYNSKALFDEMEDGVAGKIMPARKKEDIHLHFKDLAYGTYAVAAYHDLNDNGRLDKNLLGIPTEPYGFSNNPTVKWEPPTYDDALFNLKQESESLQITLKYWKEY
ncbi:MAG: DUF2141 domain-containing protein [Chitinophagales bacterium]|nr:DUF2141 domain-containing protein [Chitinophagales bacterium]